MPIGLLLVKIIAIVTTPVSFVTEGRLPHPYSKPMVPRATTLPTHPLSQPWLDARGCQKDCDCSYRVSEKQAVPSTSVLLKAATEGLCLGICPLMPTYDLEYPSPSSLYPPVFKYCNKS